MICYLKKLTACLKKSKGDTLQVHVIASVDGAAGSGAVSVASAVPGKKKVSESRNESATASELVKNWKYCTKTLSSTQY